MMQRRQFLKWAVTGMAGAVAGAPFGTAHADAPSASATHGGAHAQFDHYFLRILEGFIRNARGTSTDESFAVCDFPEGTRLESCMTPTGKTYVSVARMMPAMAEWLAGGRSPAHVVDGRSVDLNDVLLRSFRHAFDPKHPDYWAEPRKDRPTQRTVESALVAMTICRLGDDFVGKLSSSERANVQTWLASCTVVPERQNNHAWFTALNQSARLVLSKKWPEFKGDEAWLVEDLKALDGLFPPNNDGWYSDRPEMPIYDYYNFWTFANFPLYWARMVGDAYPEWREKFASRARTFLEKVPYFFAAHGGYPLFGRSLLYKFALLSPLALGYEQRLWPHSPGLLRRIVRKNLEYHWDLGSYDERLGKLRETFAEHGTPNVRERYIDNGHPYWAMLGFPFLAFPKDDAFWTAEEEPLPVEKGDFSVRFDGPKMVLFGSKASGEVRWLQAENASLRDYYRDYYAKLVHSSHFAYNIVPKLDRTPPDQALVFRDTQTGQGVTRLHGPGAARGELLPDGTGVRTTWQARLGDPKDDARAMKFTVVSTVRVLGDFEQHAHEVTAPPEAVGRVEVIEGSHALGLRETDECDQEQGDGWRLLRSRKSGHVVASWNAGGFEASSTARTFDDEKQTNVNLTHPHVAVATWAAPLKSTSATFATVQYAGVKPADPSDLHRRAGELSTELKRSLAGS